MPLYLYLLVWPPSYSKHIRCLLTLAGVLQWMGNKYLLKLLVAAHSPDVRSTLKGARFGIDGFGFVHEALRLRASPFVMLVCS